MALVLKAGLRPNERASSKFVTTPQLWRTTLAVYKNRAVALQMFGCRPAGLTTQAFQATLRTTRAP